MTALAALGAVVLALLCVLVAGLLRSHVTILRRLHELGVETEDLVGPDRERRRPPRPAPGGGGASAPAPQSLDHEPG